MSLAMKQRNSNPVDPGRSSGEPMKPQHLVIDFTPGREDTPEIQTKCHQFWEFAKNLPTLEGMMVQPVPESEHHLIELRNSPKHPDSFTERNDIPAIHTMKKLDKKGVLKAALESGEGNKYRT